jgi:group I intron endonuclease
MSIYSIYKATNKINGKSYIGFDSAWPNRMNNHKHNASNKKHFKYALYNAIRKYGWDNFEWEVVYQSKDRDYILKEMETHFIKEYNTFGNNGYNMTMGGEGAFGYKHTKEFIEWNRIRQIQWIKDNGSYMTGKKHNEETLEKISKGRRLSNHSPFAGKKHNEETKRKQSLANIGRVSHNKGKKISPETIEKMRITKVNKSNRLYSFVDPSGNTHNTNNMKEFCRDNVLSYASMGRVVNGHSNHHKGWTVLKTHEEMELKRLLKVKQREDNPPVNNSKIIMECPHCGVKMGANNIKRYHFDNCKKKGII